MHYVKSGHTLMLWVVYFIYAKSWWRKIQQIGLAADYSKDNGIGKYFKYIFGLPFLHPEQVIFL